MNNKEVFISKTLKVAIAEYGHKAAGFFHNPNPHPNLGNESF